MNTGKYGPDMFCEFVCDFMERNQKDPFFVYYPMVLVHDPFVKTPDTIGTDDRGQVANKAPKDRDTQKENFVAMVNYMDKIVGRIVKKVDDLGQLENTIILFTADNGTNRRITSRWNGQDIQGGKGGMKDMGTHVPLVAYWKGHTPEGRVSDDLIDFTDFFPTFSEAAKSDEMTNDGHSFFPQLNGEPSQPRDWVFCHYQPYWNKKAGQFVRNEKYKLYDDGRLFKIPEDLKEENDIGESGDQRVRAVREILSGVLDLAPPAPKGSKADRNTKQRPVFPKWKAMNRR
jgi:arylsulfatase A-like enzyme